MRTILSIISMIAASAVQSQACATSDLIQGLGDGYRTILTRPEMQHTWGTPDGFFLIHYDTEGERAVYHPDEDENPVDGVPDYVNRLGEFLQRSFGVIIVEMGYDPPPSDEGLGGDDRYDVYITDVPALTTPEFPSDQYPGRPAYSSYIQLGYDMRSPRYPDDPYPLLKVSTAHEFFHATQFAYRAFSSDIVAWWFECTACWAEEMVFDDINDVYFRIEHYLPFLHQSLYQTESPFIYGAWLFPEYLFEKIGPWVIRMSWEKFASSDLAMEAITSAFRESGLDFRVEYCNHIIWNYFTGPNYHQGFYQEAADFEATVNLARVHYSYPVTWSDNPLDQENVSGAFIEFHKPQVTKGSLIVDYLNPTDDIHSLSVAVIRFPSVVETFVYPTESHEITTITVPDIVQCEKVIVMPVWCYEGRPRTGTTRYSYRAKIDSSQTPVAEGEVSPAEFELRGLYPNPFNSSVIIEFSSPDDGQFQLRVFDIRGRLVFVDEKPCRAGMNRYGWSAPAEMAGGVYFFQVVSNSYKGSGKMIYLK
jgi:hypothetical protein